MTINYYKTKRGYIATDSSVKLIAHGKPSGDTLVFGRGPAMDWDLGSIADEIFVVKSLGECVTDVPSEWVEVLGFEAPPVLGRQKTKDLHPSKSDNITTSSKKVISVSRITNPVVPIWLPFWAFWMGLMLGTWFTFTFMK